MLTAALVIAHAAIATLPPSDHTQDHRLPKYAVVPFGDLPGGIEHSEAVAMNEHGTVVGVSLVDGNRRRAFIWSFRDGTRELAWPTLVETIPTAIAGDGTVYGSADDGHDRRAVVWSPLGTARRGGDLGGGFLFSRITGANASGAVVGVSTGVRGLRGVTGWPNSFTPFGQSEFVFYPRGLSPSGVAVGALGRGVWAAPAIAYDAGGGAHEVTPLPVPPDGTGRGAALAINSRGDIAGLLNLDTRDGVTTPVIWDRHGRITTPAMRTDWDEPSTGAALALNDRSDAVGWLDFGPGPRGFAWLRDRGHSSMDLTEHLANRFEGWTVVSAVGINSRGWIAATVRRPDGVATAALLVRQSSLSDLDVTGPSGSPDGSVGPEDLVAWTDKWSRGGLGADIGGPDGYPDGIVDQLDFLRAMELWNERAP